MGRADMATVEPQHLTYEEYEALPESMQLRELVDGLLVVSPEPRFVHQRAVTELLVRLHAHASPRGDAVVPAPFGIRTGERTVVQPDIVYFRADHLDFHPDEHAVRTPPDLVVEVLSPSTRSHDLVRKRRIFEQHGIREVWFVDVDTRRIEQLALGEDGAFVSPLVHEAGATVASVAVPGLSIPVRDVLPDDPAGPADG